MSTNGVTILIMFSDQEVVLLPRQNPERHFIGNYKLQPKFFGQRERKQGDDASKLFFPQSIS